MSNVIGSVDGACGDAAADSDGLVDADPVAAGSDEAEFPLLDEQPASRPAIRTTQMNQAKLVLLFLMLLMRDDLLVFYLF